MEVEVGADAQQHDAECVEEDEHAKLGVHVTLSVPPDQCEMCAADEHDDDAEEDVDAARRVLVKDERADERDHHDERRQKAHHQVDGSLPRSRLAVAEERVLQVRVGAPATH